ncbi:hypothetical protein OPU71_10220 [Niveibacterium sp. 24ML]|uniref:hypothetical protein n=1 Tax=Niveibacterium sp. 24ML TaxID=2985512 RepID=UPI00226D841E|nr:hypothetical protein [Niveibacterium sp. 24ML]MCX9156496.1 hypothetical protein [Niveibacterium sp. 24ML]
MKTIITFTVETDNLSNLTDEYISQLWHVSQANPAPIDSAEAGEFAETVGREIIRRWLSAQPPALWNHQGRHYNSTVLSRIARRVGDDWVPLRSSDSD